MFGCGLIHTTPYHPQGNGVLERLHGTLKPMLAKAADLGVDWVRFTPMALFALRQMPHIDTGLSPFEDISRHDRILPTIRSKVRRDVCCSDTPYHQGGIGCSALDGGR